MTDNNNQPPHELILDLLRAVRADQAKTDRRIELMQGDVLSLRKDVHGLRGELLRFEESVAAMGAQIERINTRLGLNETPQ